MAENNILKIIKESGLSHAEVTALIKKEGKTKLLTQEEIAEKAKADAESMDLLAQIQAKGDAEAKAKKKAEKDKPPPKEPEKDPIAKQLEAIQIQLEELKKTGKVPGKTPSKGKEMEAGALPETASFTVQKNMFEVDV